MIILTANEEPTEAEKKAYAEGWRPWFPISAEGYLETWHSTTHITRRHNDGDVEVASSRERERSADRKER